MEHKTAQKRNVGKNSKENFLERKQVLAITVSFILVVAVAILAIPIISIIVAVIVGVGLVFFIAGTTAQTIQSHTHTTAKAAADNQQDLLERLRHVKDALQMGDIMARIDRIQVNDLNRPAVAELNAILDAMFAYVESATNQTDEASATNYKIEKELTRYQKIIDYQQKEIAAITHYLEQGLAQGILNYIHAPNQPGMGLEEAAALCNGMGAALEAAVTNIKDCVDKTTDALAQVAKGQLTHTIPKEFIGNFNGIRMGINQLVTKLNAAIADIAFISDGVSSGSSHLAQSYGKMAEEVVAQITTVEDMAEDLHLIDRQAQHNSDNAQKATDLAQLSRAHMEAGSQKMKNLEVVIGRIANSANKISQVIQTIEDIAFQTNMLALNASVEAARAGEEGKGFRVVAEEVRTLAILSSEAAKDTTSLIEESIRNVAEGTAAAKDTAASLDKIVRDILNVCDVVSEISEASTTQTHALGNINAHLKKVSGTLNQSAATSQKTARDSQSLEGQIILLRDRLGFFAVNVTSLAIKKVWDVNTSGRMSGNVLETAPGTRRVFTKGDVIVEEGDRDAQTMYFVLKGTVKVVKGYGSLNEVVLAILKPGDLFGEMALVLNEPRTAKVVALEPVTLMEIHRETFLPLIEKNPETAFVIIETLCKRLKNITM